MTSGFTGADPGTSDQAGNQARWRSFDALPYAYGGPCLHARLRSRPDDFVVDEMLAFGPDGEGEHVLLQVRKTSANTDWAARRIAVLAGVPVKAVGYAGLKDRHAVTTQWFSVHLGRLPEPRWALLAEEGLEVLEQHRHRRKLKRGSLAGNRFRIWLREVSGDIDRAMARVEAIAARGVPNYFGPQRFGRGQGNLAQADALFAGRPGRASRHQRGLWISAARSYLFNEVLARRIERQDWTTALVGDRMQLRGSHSHFLLEAPDEGVEERVAAGDLSPTGPLFGVGDPETLGQVQELEQQVLAENPRWVQGLAKAGLKQERRALRLDIESLSIEQIDTDDLLLRFTLPAGSYATSVLRELCRWEEGPSRSDQQEDAAADRQLFASP